jgi:hypothetical protein
MRSSSKTIFRNMIFSFLLFMLPIAASALPCGPIFKKAKLLPKDGKGKAPCVLETQEPGPRRGSFIAYYYCSEEKKRYELTIEEDLTCEAK